MSRLMTYAGSTNGSLFWCVDDIIGRGVDSLPQPPFFDPSKDTNLPENEETGENNTENTVVNADGLNSHPTVSNTPLLKKAIIDQSTYAFTKLVVDEKIGERPGKCAAFAYNIAYKLKEHITKKSSTAIPWLKAGSGNADQPSHREAIKNLGIYQEYYLGEFTAAELKSASGPIKSRSWNYGDIVNYYAPGHSGDSNMHSQIYTGDIWQKGINGKGVKNAAENSGWTTSGKTNYGAWFVYSSSQLKFKLYVFKVKSEYLK